MLEQYFPILVFIAIAVAIPVMLLVMGYMLTSFLKVRRPDAIKNAAYECGFAAFEDARKPFDVRFYLVAILFILFDLETAFLFPWAVALHKIGWTGFTAMIIFLVLLTVGFVYEWKKGALEWE